MRIDLKEFIEKYKDDINRNLFKKIYFLAIFGELSSPNIGKFTELLYKCGIDPLEHMTKIPVGFAYGSSLKNIKIPNSITFIGAWAFAYCIALTSMTIPDSVTTIGNSAFESCFGLTSVTIGNGVTSIGDSVFSGCSGLISAAIGNSVTSISYQAFYNCRSLTKVTIPDSVTTIGPDAFYNCMSLKAINYSGSKKQWELIKKRLNWKNKSLIQIIHCLDGDITL